MDEAFTKFWTNLRDITLWMHDLKSFRILRPLSTIELGVHVHRDQKWRKGDTDYIERVFFSCGPPRMVEALERLLEGFHVP